MIIRRAKSADLDALGRLGLSMMRTHCAFDERRYIPAEGDAEAVYSAFLAAFIDADDAVVLVAEETESEIVAYVYAAVEPPSFKELRDRAGFVHDLIVADGARGGGVGHQLLEAAVQWLKERGMPRVILWRAEQNTGAQRLFERRGFRRTMIEMTRELEDIGKP